MKTFLAKKAGGLAGGNGEATSRGSLLLEVVVEDVRLSCDDLGGERGLDVVLGRDQLRGGPPPAAGDVLLVGLEDESCERMTTLYEPGVSLLSRSI